MDEPNASYDSAPRSTASPIQGLISDPSINGDAFNQLLQNRGIRFIHHVATPCPNMKDLNSNNHDPNCPFCDNSQIIHLEGKEIWGTFTSNSLEKMFEVQGVWEIGTAVISFPTMYMDKEQADFNAFDKLICPDFQVRLNDLIQYEPTNNDIQYLRYPIVKIQNMTSVVDDALYTYTVDVDFTIEDGGIKWINKPLYDDMIELGEVISVTYVANPVYAVLNVMHELRVTQEFDIMTGQKVAKRLPQQILVKRDFLVNDKK